MSADQQGFGISISGPFSAIAVAALNAYTAILNRETTLLQLDTPEARQALADDREAKALPMWIIREVNKGLGISPTPPPPAGAAK